MEIVAAYACSHSGLLISREHDAPRAQRDAIFDAFATMGAEIRAAAPDAVIVVGTDHLRVYPFAGIPQFTIGVSATAEGIGDAELPPCTVPVAVPVARALLDGALAGGVDLAFSEAMRIDHSFVAPLMLAFGDAPPPIVAIAQNCNVPPLPPLARSHAVGTLLGAALRAAPGGRVAVIATGGLSHWVGPVSYQDFMRQPAGSRIAQGKPALVLEPAGHVAVAFDEAFLATICRGEARAFIAAWTPDRLQAEAGNGAQELRNWLLVAGLTGDRPATVMAYEPVAEWLTGTGIVRFAL